jgi:hypothetical protein
MNNTDDSASEEEQLATVPMNYRALLAMTRPLVITEYTPLSLRGDDIPHSGFGISPEPDDWHTDFTLRRGEILHPEGECDVARESISALGEIGPNLKLRIYLGMS